MSNSNLKISQIEIGGQIYDIGGSTDDISQATDATVGFSEDLFLYTPLGMAQKVDADGAIGAGNIAISNEHPGKLATAGVTTLKDVFTTIFGEQAEKEPTINVNNVKLTVTQASIAGTGYELGTVIPASSTSITFTVSNSATASYGYTYGTNNTPDYTRDASFIYPLVPWTFGDNNSQTAQLKIDVSASPPATAVAAQGLVTTGTYKGYVQSGSTAYLYCDFVDSEVSLNVNLPLAEVSNTRTSRHGSILGEVQFGSPTTSSGAGITKFLTLKKANAADQSLLNGDKILQKNRQAATGNWDIAAATYHSFYCFTTSQAEISSIDAEAEGVTLDDDCRLSSSGVLCDVPSGGSYVWFIIPSASATVATKMYFDYQGPDGIWYTLSNGEQAIGPVQVTVTLSTGAEALYWGYRTYSTVTAGGTQLRLTKVESI